MKAKSEALCLNAIINSLFLIDLVILQILFDKSGKQTGFN